MPSDHPARRRALALGVVAALGLTLAPAGGAVADESPSTGTALRTLSRIVESTSLAISAPALRQAPRPAVAPPPAIFRHAGSDGSDGLPRSAAEAPNARDAIAARCPDLDDARLLRDGADADGQGLCVRSVLQARSDLAAAAVVEGFGLLGLPYSRGRRLQDGYDDCSSFVGRSYRDAGRPLSDTHWEPSSSAMRNASWAGVVDNALPGDILWRRGHVAMALADDYMMHASQSGDVTHVRKAGRYSKALAVDAGA